MTATDAVTVTVTLVFVDMISLTCVLIKECLDMGIQSITLSSSLLSTLANVNSRPYTLALSLKPSYQVLEIAGFSSQEQKEAPDLLQSVIESTADNLMELFQANRQEENDKKMRGHILGELNKLKDSVFSFAQEQVSAKMVKKILAGKESDIVESVPSKLAKTPHVLKPSSIHSLSKESDDKEQLKHKVGIKRPHPDPHFSQPSPKIPCMPSTVDNNKQTKVIDLTTTSVEDKEPVSKLGLSTRDVAVIGGVTGNTRMKTSTISASDKIVGGYVPKVDKQPTSLTTVKRQRLTKAESVRSTKISKGGAKSSAKKHKFNLPPLKRPIKQPRAPSNVGRKKPRGRSKPGSKRVRKSRCTEKVKKYCHVCSKPDCGKCKNCL